ncbi:Purine nucleoside receptor A [Acholeplasma oculi]|uniref:BMP family lipoprotein n=1 Tax=Acholeplasma oculi TaxID=35623 RepID=UPI000E15D3E8|nr:BMP family ABC transporter substrate-binding protein [Acholeplasma oculi]SUT90959.1 Purine nucleoside receptor A [Acholeplasma oculi]
MKKILALLILSVFSLVLVACGEQTTEWNIVMLTDVGTITDKSFNQGTWEGVKAFAEDNDITHSYFRPNAATHASYLESIDMVVANGANVVVTPGFLFETAIYEAQSRYPDVYFILIDGEPHTPDYSTFRTDDNVVNILFQEEQSGFLAGYAAVADGFTNLGYMGGMEVPAVQKFGIGYVAGAYYAANALSKTITFDASRYEYLGDFDNKPEHTTKAASWYNAGVELIFVAAGGAGNAVMAAAEATSGKFVIGVDVDQAGESDTVISSAMKELAIAVRQELQALIDGNWNGGQTLRKSAANDSVGLPTAQASWRFRTFTQAQYETVLGKVKDGTITVPQTKAQLTAFLAANGNPSAAALVNKTVTE